LISRWSCFEKANAQVEAIGWVDAFDAQRTGGDERSWDRL
jgi:hypothetical protein